MQDTVRDTSIERLSKIISDPRSGRGDNNQPRRPSFQIHLHLEEGWFSLILVAAVVYSTIWSIQTAGWVAHLGTLTWTTLLGLICGVLAAKQRRLPGLLLHVSVVIFALLLAYWQTAGAYYNGSLPGFAGGIERWFLSVLAGGNGEDDSIFFFFITALSFVLAYASAWLVYRTRSPWLAIVANAVVLLINLSNLDPGYVIFLVVFLMSALLLLLRFNLFESVKRWRRQGLRYADDLGWDVMQAGTLISIGILIVSWFLPWGYTNPYAAQIWNLNANPVIQLEDTWNRVISMSGGTNTSNHGIFNDTLALAGNPNLNHDPVFQVSSNDPSQYLAALAYDTYDGVRNWTDSSTFSLTLQPNDSIPAESSVVHAVVQHITVVNPPGGEYQYVFGASQIGSVNLPALALSSQSDDSLVGLLVRNGRLAPGEHYTVTSYVSSADENALRSVPMPADSPHFPPNYEGQLPLTYFDPAVLSQNLQVPKGLDPNIAALARRITANAPTMYDKAIALENYFRTNFTYDANINPPSDQEAISWFLFRSGQKGFCNYFASSMAIMARLVGIPARVVVGYTNGKYDTKLHSWVIEGADAHAWTQVYFAGYGWINFEPSAGFPTFTRPYPGEFGAGSSTSITGGGSNTPTKGKRGRLGGNEIPATGNSAPAEVPGQQGSHLNQQIGFALGSIVLLILFGLMLFSIWWHRLFRHYKISRRIIGRLCLLASWAGISFQRSQTPYEYIHTLAVAAPAEAAALERLGDIYVREQWADPKSAEHPERSGEIDEMEGLWKHLQPRLFLYVLRHPSFLYAVPGRVGKSLKRWQARRRTLFEEEEL